MRDKPSVVGQGWAISNSDTFYQPHLGIPLPPSHTCSALSVFLMSPTTKVVLPHRNVAPVGWTPIYLCLTWACERGNSSQIFFWPLLWRRVHNLVLIFTPGNMSQPSQAATNDNTTSTSCQDSHNLYTTLTDRPLHHGDVLGNGQCTNETSV